MNLTLLDFFIKLGLSWQVFLKKTKVKLDRLSEIHMLLMVEKCIRGGICETHVKANN